MKKTVLVGTALLLSVLMACGAKEIQEQEQKKDIPSVTLTVSTMYAGNDSNAENFKEASQKWEEMTGNEIDDVSSTADEAYKSRVLMDFQTGDEPDVLFFFNGVDSNPLVSNNRVVSVDEIREVYPEYAMNMKESMMKASPYDGKIYCIPVNGYWEALYVNKALCQKVGVSIPNEHTTWEEFVAMCKKIEEQGYTPIAASLCEVPHYWFEYCIFNHQSVNTHANVPTHGSDAYARAWMDGLEDLKEMYEQDFFPQNTLSMSDAEAKRMFTSGEAAFMLEGSWNVSWLEKEVNNPEDYEVTFVPGMGERKTTDIISGLSTGYYITRKAWEDPQKQEATKDFVEYMTSDEMVTRFAEVSATALVNGVSIEESKISDFVASAMHMAERATGVSEAVQDYLTTSERAPIFENMKALMTGEEEIEVAVKEVIKAANEGK